MIPRERPPTLEEIDAFEEANKISVNLYRWRTCRGVQRGFLQVIRQPTYFDREVMILRHRDHYCPVKNFAAFFDSRGGCITMTRSRRNVYCHRCLQGFRNKTRPKQHLQRCEGTLPQKPLPPRLPVQTGHFPVRTWFKDIKHLIPHPLVC